MRAEIEVMSNKGATIDSIDSGSFDEHQFPAEHNYMVSDKESDDMDGGCDSRIDGPLS